MSAVVDALASGASMLAHPVLLATGSTGSTGGTQTGGQGQEFGSASTLGFVVLVLFFIAVAFLARSMAKHLKRIQKVAAANEEQAQAADPDASEPGAEDSTDTTPAEADPTEEKAPDKADA